MKFVFVVAVLLWSSVVLAEEEPTPAASETTAPVMKKAKGNRSREKETEGTEAPNRFEADTVIKSQYKLNGEPLEVDPD